MKAEGFARALHADGPAHDLAREPDLYALLVGDWDIDVTTHSEQGESSWILRPTRSAGAPKRRATMAQPGVA